ncbi:MAG: flagellar M-ring protein FliF [Magnetospirillum sp. WYHS-4]
MDAFLQTLRNLGPVRLAIVGAVVFGMIAFFIFLTTRLSTPQMALLFGELDPADTGKITQHLEQSKVPYEIRNNGTAIFVPNDQAHKMRMDLTNKGVTAGGSLGYEIFDKNDSLGTTNFQQNINLIRAMEGELARTIKTLDGVHAARVHIVMPRRELFSRERQEPSASVILKMKSKGRLGREQVQAIQHLVAGAIPSMNPSRISIIDDKGMLLSRGFEDSASPQAVAAKVEEQRLAFERRMARTIEDLLEKSAGFGKVRAEVSAEMDYDRVATTEEKFDPDGQVVRSTQTDEEKDSSKEAQQEPVSVGQNLPDASTSSEGASASAARSRTHETVNFEISKRVINHVREGGIVKRLSVAVLVDGHYAKDKDGKTTYADRSEKEMERLAMLVKGAIGFDAKRNDIVEVINMRFAEPPTPTDEPLELFFGFGKDDLVRIAEILVLSIVAILVILLVVRPLITRAFEAMPSAQAAEGLLAERGGAPALTGPGGLPLPVPSEGGEEGESFEELIDIDRVEGRVKASSVRKVGEIVEKHPEEALAIIRSWMYQES